MEVTIYKRNTEGEEKAYHHFYFNEEEGLYSNIETQFAHVMWDRLIKQRFGHEFVYICDYYDYTSEFSRFGYKGEGIYYKGKKIIDVDDLSNGIRDIEIKNNLYLIK